MTRVRWTVFVICLALSALRPTTSHGQYRGPTGDFLLTLAAGVPRAALGQRNPRPLPMIGVQTADTLGCILRLGIRSRVRGRRIRVIIDGVDDRPIPCAQEPSPATGGVAFDVPPGVYDLEVVAAALTDRYALRVSDTLMSIIGPTKGSFTRVLNAVFRRPWPSSLAMYCSARTAPPDTVVTRLCREFGRILVDSLGATEISYSAEQESPFSRMKYVPRESTRYFHYRRVGDFDRAFDLLQRFRHNAMAGAAPTLGIGLQDWRGWYVDSSPTSSRPRW